MSREVKDGCELVWDGVMQKRDNVFVTDDLIVEEIK